MKHRPMIPAVMFSLLVIPGIVGCGDDFTGPASEVQSPGLREHVTQVMYGSSASGRQIVGIDGKAPSVINVQLRAIDPEDATTDPSAARGHLQLKLRNAGDGTYAVQWSGRIFNPSGESFIGGGIYSIGEVDGRPILNFGFVAPDVGDKDTGVTGCSTAVRVEGSAFLPAVQAEVIVEDPNIFEVRFSTRALPRGAIAGNLGGSAWGGVDDPTLKPVECGDGSV